MVARRPVKMIDMDPVLNNCLVDCTIQSLPG
ncbi:acyl-CoA synthase [Yoonia vestfoldensis SKA53]|uniref:Acyl-CoA synthase n=1 Tax=Yoonia vestfoldensis SKA53 TaxID=314232 RepID=A3V715_9RHOB|nr:acyl-CoA synthase [Yoonia vestfoldensis SKA53]